MSSTSTPPLAPYKAAFLRVCLDAQILQFGRFTLKSGRQSPYFFNTSSFHTAALLDALALAYAHALVAHAPALAFAVLFGPAYKGIPLAVATVGRLATLDRARFGGVSYAFDRKEAKDHGEGGRLVGATVRGRRVVVIDDVVTAGTAKREAVELIRAHGGEVVAMVVALDRREKMPAEEGEDDEDGVARESAIGRLRKEYGIPILSVLTLEDLIGGLKAEGLAGEAEACEAYWAKYRASD